jgi:tetratricopeptide (TPR) repeat protein
MTARPIVLLAFAAAIALAPRAARADGPKRPSPKDLAEARAHFKDAEAAKARGDYQTAAVEYLAAYQLFEEPEFFFDTAEVYRLGGDEPNALTYYEKYLELDPQGRGAPVARTAADALRRSIAAKEDAARRAADDDAKRKADDEAKRKADDDARRQAALHAAEPPPAPPPAPPPSHRGRTLRIAGIVSGIDGVVLLGAGISYGLRARSISDEASGWTTFDPQRYAQGHAAQRDMLVLTGAGAAALITGGVLYYLGHDHARERDDAGTITFAPSIDGSSIGFVAAGRF